MYEAHIGGTAYGRVERIRRTAGEQPSTCCMRRGRRTKEHRRYIYNTRMLHTVKNKPDERATYIYTYALFSWTPVRIKFAEKSNTKLRDCGFEHKFVKQKYH